MRNVLGISLGTRTVGLAVFYKGKLSDWRMKTFYDKWSDVKCTAILGMIEKMVLRNGSSAIAIKTPIPELCSENIRRLLEGVQALSLKHRTTFLHCTIHDLKARYSPEYRVHKDIFISTMLERYPRLAGIYEKKKRHGSYYDKIFEAIECGEYALEAGL